MYACVFVCTYVRACTRAHSLCSPHAPRELRRADAVSGAHADPPQCVLHHEAKALLQVAALQAAGCRADACVYIAVCTNV